MNSQRVKRVNGILPRKRIESLKALADVTRSSVAQARYFPSHRDRPTPRLRGADGLRASSTEMVVYAAALRNKPGPFHGIRLFSTRGHKRAD